jgi:hypothetical protein
MKEKIRQRYSKETWTRKVQKLQELSQEACSGLHYRPINSADLLFKIQVQEDIWKISEDYQSDTVH